MRASRDGCRSIADKEKWGNNPLPEKHRPVPSDRSVDQAPICQVSSRYKEEVMESDHNAISGGILTACDVYRMQSVGAMQPPSPFVIFSAFVPAPGLEQIYFPACIWCNYTESIINLTAPWQRSLQNGTVCCGCRWNQYAPWSPLSIGKPLTRTINWLIKIHLENNVHFDKYFLTHTCRKNSRMHLKMSGCFQFICCFIFCFLNKVNGWSPPPSKQCPTLDTLVPSVGHRKYN